MLFSVLHTSASLALNESWDPDVRDDMEMMLNKIVPEGLPYRHSCEGPDDMVSVWYYYTINYIYWRIVVNFLMKTLKALNLESTPSLCADCHLLFLDLDLVVILASYNGAKVC